MDAWLKKAKQQEKQKYIIVVNLNNSKMAGKACAVSIGENKLL